MKPLAAKTPLRLNAWFSLGTGVLLAATPGMIGDWLGVSIDNWLRLLGVGLVGHAAVLFWMIAKLDVRRVLRINLAMITPYPLIMLSLVVFAIVTKLLGQLLVLADGAIIAALVTLHVMTLRSEAASESVQLV